MDCPYLEEGKTSRVCIASVTLMVPSMEEARDYCTTEDHDSCPVLLGHVLRGGYDAYYTKACGNQ